MKFCTILISVTLFFFSPASVSFGKTVGESQAKKAGMNFLNEKGIPVPAASSLTTVYTATGNIAGNTITSYYVFNLTGGHAFVIVSADDRIRPILAYSGESGFDMAAMSPAARDWVDGYRNQVATAIANNVPAKSTTAGAWSDLIAGTSAGPAERTTNAGPLLDSGNLIWNQSPYYNQDCPDSGVYQAPTGCVATSMSQIMKYWNWPPVGTGYYKYQCPSFTTAPITLSAYFGNTEYAWASMPDDVTSYVPSVAQLMFQVGVSVNMYYGFQESGAEVIELQSSLRTQCSEYAFKTYFHYKRSLTGIARNGVVYIGDSVGYTDSIPEAAWTAMLQNELNAGRPVLYSGYGSVGGHAWVCDGWEGTAGLFHFNWGWGGTGPNGYYSVDDLAPPVMGIGCTGCTNFNSDQAVVIGIQPDSFPNTPGPIQLAAHLNCNTSTPMPYATPFSIITTILNSGTTSFTGDFCMQVFDTLDNMIGTIQTYTGETIAAGASMPFTFGPSALYAMIPMDYYHIRAMYRPSGATTWTAVANNGNFINYTTADVANDTDIALYANVNITTPTPVVPGASFTINTKLYNQGTADFNGTVQAVMISVATGTEYPVQALTAQTIDTFGYLDVSFTNPAFTAPDGLYALVIEHQYGGTGSFYVTSSDYYENPVWVTVGINASVPSVSTGHDVYVFPNPAKDMFTILPQGVNITGVQLFDITGRQVEKQIQPNGKSAIMVPVSGLTPGAYIVRIRTTDSGVLNKKVTIQ